VAVVDVMVSIARFVLAGVLALAALGKLSDLGGARATVVEFGGSRRHATPIAWALIGAELGIAALLAVAGSARIGGLAALVLFVAFTALVAVTVGRGRHPQCHCFGRLHSSEAEWSTVARNALLTIVAGYVAVNGQLPIMFAALGAIATTWWAWIRSRMPGPLRRGSAAPEISLPDSAGRNSTLESLLAAGRPLLLLFADADCGACRELLPQVVDWQRHHRNEVTVTLVTRGAASEPALSAVDGLGASLADEDRDIAAKYGITATPTAVLVDQQRRLVDRPAVGADEIAALLWRALATDPAIERRVVLARAATGFAALIVVPLVTSAAAAADAVKRVVRAKQLKIDGAWLCDQRYALCTFARCEPSKTNKKISICRCKVKTGYSVGFKTCQKRAPRGRELHSNFSLQDVTSRTRVLKCSERGKWVQCLDVVCHVDPKDSKHALCECVNEHTKNFYTFGGNCDTKMCKTVIWSATTAPFPGGAQYEKGLRRLGIPFRSPKACPAPKKD
jgi:thiol-disulfide isomerase/thioredoxin